MLEDSLPSGSMTTWESRETTSSIRSTSKYYIIPQSSPKQINSSLARLACNWTSRGYLKATIVTQYNYSVYYYARFSRRTSYEPNRTLMRENKWFFFSFTFDSAPVKYGVWTWRKLSSNPEYTKLQSALVKCMSLQDHETERERKKTKRCTAMKATKLAIPQEEFVSKLICSWYCCRKFIFFLFRTFDISLPIFQILAKYFISNITRTGTLDYSCWYIPFGAGTMRICY